ncbi:multidrug resistance-associated ABC transporter [Mycena sp. CBHHK59/15]|nr:multidrug resistance-associated ABC transporter [Mycena sp. CBHHK59/15]
MPFYQLEISVALAITAVGSVALFFLNRPSQGSIELPVHEDVHRDDHDPFDVTEPIDAIDGYPIKGEEFWTRMTRRKIFLRTLVAALLIVEAFGHSWLVAHGENWDKGVLIFDLCYTLYLFCLGTLCVDQVERHSEFMWHLTTLTTLPAMLMLFATILPVNQGTASSSSPALWFWRAVLSIYAALAVVTLTTPLGPPLYYPPSAIYSEETASAITNTEKENVTGVAGSSPWGTLYFSYVTRVVTLGNMVETLEIGDLPLMPAQLRATVNYSILRRITGEVKLYFWSWTPRPGSGATLVYQIFRANLFGLSAEAALSVAAALLYYTPPLCLSKLISYLESDPARQHTSWGWFWVITLFTTNAISSLVRGQLWSLCSTNVKLQIRIQLNALLFAKTLVRKDVASFAPSASDPSEDPKLPDETRKEGSEEKDFSSKAQIMTLMTTDVDRVGNVTWYLFDLIDAPIEIAIGGYFLYRLLGTSSLIGLAVTCLFSPFSHFATKGVCNAQESLLKARDERVALMNEVLGGIRMLKFMAWERNFEARVMKIREKELKYQKLSYIIEVLWGAIWNGSPMIVTLVSFWHFVVVRKEILTPSIAFTSIILFNEMKFALSAIPNSFVKISQTVLSIRRIEKYLGTAEVTYVTSPARQSQAIAFQSCTVAWPQETSPSVSASPHNFLLLDLTLIFPTGELSLICGKLGSGKSLLLLALLGEADLVAGQMHCPRSPPDALASFADACISQQDWLVEGMCAYVPQVAWLRNASIKQNILFHLPYDRERYEKTLQACALVADLEILDDGDESEIGELGVTLSGGQKARVSLARAVYSRASFLLLDDVLSAVDAHTAHHLYHACLKGELMRGRSVILVSHHVQLCAPGAAYIVALDNGRVQFQGGNAEFQSSEVIKSLVQSAIEDAGDQKEEAAIEAIPSDGRKQNATSASSTSTSYQPPPSKEKTAPRKLIDKEARAVGRVARQVWATYIRACGGKTYWALFLSIFVVAALSVVLENSWLSHWSGGNGSETPTYYIMVYTMVSLVVTTCRWLVLYDGSIRASTVLYKRLLEAVLFADIRFHDTASRGRLLNRFGKDFEGIDSVLPENFGNCVAYVMATIATVITMSFVGGIPFMMTAVVIGILFYNGTNWYGIVLIPEQTQSPLYSMYSENISGVAVLRAFGASSKILRDMLRCLDTNSNAFYWTWGLGRWLSIRFDFLSGAITGAIAIVAILNKNVSASMAGLALAFGNTVLCALFVGDSHPLMQIRQAASDVLFLVALERVNEYCAVQQEPPEFIAPRPSASWPAHGAIQYRDLVVRYAPELPAVLHNLTFDIRPGEKVGILGRTGSGKSTLALSLLRFVAPSEGRIVIDGMDIAQIGLTDLRSRITIIPQDPTILSGSLRSTLDVFGEYTDAEIFEALRRVHLIPASGAPDSDEARDAVNANSFRDLDAAVSEGGENFSAGEKQLLCMARAILKKSKILLMDEMPPSVDYATDELIGKTINQEFADSTILTIAHRIRSVVTYDRVMLLDQGRIAEFDRPAALLADPTSKFHALCKAAGADEFAMLKKLAGSSGFAVGKV